MFNKNLHALSPKENFDYNVFITHGANFHLDDVASTALCLLFKRENDIINNNAKEEFEIEGAYPVTNGGVVIRTLKPEEAISCLESDQLPIVYDIGRGEFDHHQEDAEVRPNGIKYAAFGLLWKKFGNHEKFPHFDERFVQLIDDHDNGGKTNFLSTLIRNFNVTPQEKCSTSEFDIDNEHFKCAVNIVYKIIYRELFTESEEADNKEYIENNAKYETLPNGKSIMILDKFVPWKQAIFDIGVDVSCCIYPHMRGGYAIEVAPVSPNSMESEWTFKPEYCGKPANELPKYVSFVHRSGFISNVNTMENAISVAKEYIVSKN